MTIGKWIGGSVTVGVLLSTLVHAGAGGGLYYAFVVDKPEPIEVEIDLSMVPLVPPDPAPPTDAPPPPPPPPAWTLPKPEELPPAPAVEEEQPEPEPPPTPVVAEPEPQEIPPAPVEQQVASVSKADVESQYLSAAQLARHPRWIKNFIRDKDYPRLAEREGKDGRVVLTVFIDETGLVKDVRLMQGSYEVLNEVALRKVREAVFSPAYNNDGRPVPSKVALPIKFELQ